MAPTSDILLITLNATYQHASFGLRYLKANLRELKPNAQILEFTLEQSPRQIVETVLRFEPKIVGFGVYIWNTRQTQEVVSVLKKLRPELVIILGGPEVSYETESQAITQIADCTIQSEAEILFYQVCRDFLGQNIRPAKIVSGALPDIKQLESPYTEYTDEDIRNRVIYVEASRGCPYRCEFCLSSLDKEVRAFPLEKFLLDMQQLLDRGVRQFKFVDRTFNLSIPTSQAILKFFLDRISLGLFLHFEMVPDRLPIELREIIQKFPKGSLQFEIGIQTWNPEVATLISRRQNLEKVKDNFSFLTQQTHAHLHADLIVGLPGETLQSFQKGFDAVSQLGSSEIQVGILKRLKGTPIIRHDKPWEMLYQEEPPFSVLQTKTMDFTTIQELSRFAKFWDLFANSGNFPKLMTWVRSHPSVFDVFWEFSHFLSKRHPKTHSIALVKLVESAWRFLTEEKKVEQVIAREMLLYDYCGRVKRDIPEFLRTPGMRAREWATIPTAKTSWTPSRQERHLQ